MDDYEAKIATEVAEKSVELYDRLLESVKTLGYEVIRKSILEDLPKNDEMAVDPFAVFREVINSMEEHKILGSLTKEQRNYVKVSEIVKPKSEKTC